MKSVRSGSSWRPWLALLTLLSACSESRSVIGGDAPSSRVDAVDDIVDAPDADDALDTPDAPDVTLDAPDVALDVALDTPDVTLDTPDVPSVCRADEDCASNAAGAVCDVATGRCVRCTVAHDTCPAAQHCDANACVDGCRADDGCATPADAGADAGAGGVCDTANHRCVACVRDEHCPSGTLCMSNRCVPGCSAVHACPAGLACCAGGCVDLATSADTCGACGTRCAIAHGVAGCTGGMCSVAACADGYADCDGAPANGCETDTRATTAACGSCGHACAYAHAGAACDAGRCVMGTCDAGFADCDGDASNGCEVDTRSSLTDCGACGRACAFARATAECAVGVCRRVACAAGFGDCDGDASNGCETALTSDVAHCGACDTACGFAHAAATCASSTCAMGACGAGYGDCDGRAATGCEVDLTSTVTACGACGRACAVAHGTPGCTASTCRVASCDAGYADCDGDAANGCEVDTQTSATSCGSCGTRCDAGLSCVAGRCTAASTTCRQVFDAGLSRGDGVYTITLGGVPTPVRCLMSVDGGGWTMVGNFPYPGNTAGVAGWTSGARVGASFTDLTRAFKLSDAEINAMRTTGFRAHGAATACVGGPCTVDTTLYWRPTCAYASGSNSAACDTAYRDAAFTTLESSATPCAWHWGLVASNCSSTAVFGTSHVDNHVFVGNYGTYVHAYDGRGSENPSVQFWVR